MMSSASSPTKPRKRRNRRRPVAVDQYLTHTGPSLSNIDKTTASGKISGKDSETGSVTNHGNVNGQRHLSSVRAHSHVSSAQSVVDGSHNASVDSTDNLPPMTSRTEQGFRCDLCDVFFGPSTLALNRHLLGRQHWSRDPALAEASVASIVSESGQSFIGGDAQDLVVSAGQHGFRCNVCHVACFSIYNLKEHMAGKMHRAQISVAKLNKCAASQDHGEEDKQGRFGFKLHIVNATVADNGNIEMKIPLDRAKAANNYVKFVLENTGDINITICSCQLLTTRGCSLSEVKKNLVLKPGAKVEAKVSPSRRQVGRYATVIVFMLTADDAADVHVRHVIRKVAIDIEDTHLEDLRPTAPFVKPPRVSGKEAVTEIIEGLPLDGKYDSTVNQLEKVVKLSEYLVPQKLRHIINRGLDIAAKSDEYADRIRLVLDSELNGRTHLDIFSMLLYIEEIQMEVDIRKYDLSKVTVSQYKDNRRLLQLKVPGLMEKRPSVLRGDHLYIRRVGGDGKPERLEYKGYVHEVQSDQVCLGFGEKLMELWMNNMKFNCRFVFNRLPLKLQHRAVMLASELGLDGFLFPTAAMIRNELVMPLDRLQQMRLFNDKINANKEQKTAVRNIVAGTSRPAPFLVFGPPGTGKTITIVEAMKQILKEIPTAHILACAPSNSAADLLAVGVLEHLPVKSKLFRLYAASFDPNSIPDQLKKHCNHQSGRFMFPSRDELMKNSIIVSTLVSAGRIVSANFPPGHFTHIFIDESGQATEPEALIAIAGIYESDCMSKDGGQVVLAGDPEQLGPVLRSPIAIRCGLGMSLLERYMKHIDIYQRRTAADVVTNGYNGFDERFVVKLIRNYRSHPKILEIPNELFYDRELETHADKLQRESLCLWSELPKQKFPLVFHGVVGKDEREERSPSYFNVDEISVVTAYIKNLLTARGICQVKQKDIGIISPYRKQVQKIRQALKKSNWSNISVGSVEEFQGQERRVIIISTVRSNVEHIAIDCKFHLGFLRNPKRFNVAITRAKALLIVVGNPFVLSNDTCWKSLLSFCLNNCAYTGCEFTAEQLDSDVDVDKLLSQMQDLHLNETSLNVGPITEHHEPQWSDNM